jgi:hypothetical protein
VIRGIVWAPLLALAASAAAAQQPFGSGPYDPAVPTPRSVLGYEVGDRFTPHHMLTRYIERVAAASRRIRVDTVALTFEGREVFLIAASSEANIARLDQIRADAARLAEPRGGSASDLAAAAARMPAVVWLGYTVHGNEASGVEAAIALLYQLAAGRDAETQLLLDSLVVLIDPVENPDGHERHVQDVNRLRGAFDVPTSPAAMVHQGNWPGPRTSHYYFDLNRDWFTMSHPETRGRIASFLRWWPMAAVDLHEQGSNATYYFAPPMGPVNANVPEIIRRWWDIYAQGNIAAFDQHGWSFFRRESYDEFYPGYGDSWPILAGAVGMTFEQATSAGGAIRRTDGSVLTLHDAAWHHYTAAWATLVTTAHRARQRVGDFLAFRQSAVSEGERLAARVVVFERDETGRADTLAAHLLANGIAVGRLRAAADLSGATPYGESAPRSGRVAAGAYVVDLAQPQGRLAKALLEVDAQLDSSFIREELEHRRTGEPDRFYDITAWSLPLAYRLHAWSARATPGATEPVAPADFGAQSPRVPAPAPGRYGYAIRPGSEASLRMLAGLLADSVRVWFAVHPFTQGAESFPNGAFVVRAAANGPLVHDVVRRRQAETGTTVVPLASAAADDGTDLGSNSVFPLKRPRIALAGGAPVFGNSFGFAWFAFDQRLGYPVTPLSVQAVAAGRLDDFDVLVVPSVGAAALDGALGEGGKTRLGDWVRAGGTLVTLEGATQWLAAERGGLARMRLRRDTVRADSVGGAPLPADVPGAILRAYGDTLSPLMAGIRGDIPVLSNSDRVYNAPKDLRAGEAIVRYAPLPRLRLSGYLWPEMPARLAESVYLWTERVGRGRVIGFAGDPVFRDHFRGLLPLFANAVLIGPSM